MYPVICQIGPLTLYSYGAMLTVAVLVCSTLLYRDAKKQGARADAILDLVFWCILGGIAGARVFFILLNLDFFLNNPIEIVMLQHGGLAFQGGLVGGFLSGLYFARKNSLPILKTMDLVAPYIALGHAIGRIGCFLNGCCYGKPVEWGVYFPAHHEHLHPTQLYESLGLVLVFFFLKKAQGFSKYPGQVFIFYLAAASALRFANEFFRDDHSALFLGLSIFQIISLILFAVALYANTLIKSRTRR